MIRPLLAALPLLAACTTEPAHDPHLPAVEVEVRRLTERIDEVLEHEGTVYVHFERSSLRYRIDPADPRAAELEVAARAALAHGFAITALIDRASIPPTKSREHFE